MAASTLPLVVPVRFSGGGLSMQTTSSRIGSEGVFVRCLVSPREGARVMVALTLPGNARPVEAAGTVTERAHGNAPGKESGFWVQFEALSGEAQAALDALLRDRGMGPPPAAAKPAPPAPARIERGFPRVQTRLQVGWSSPREFLVAYSENISRGGIFVATQNPPPVREMVELLLELPDGQAPAKTSAEVVQCVTAEQARATGRTAGAGLQFIGGDEDFRRRVDACIEHLLQKD
ncbi:MAG TPA: PilZ domain-containing protein [Myxococcales bacterium]